MSKLFNPDYLRELCKKYRLVPSSKYGQNFLIDESVIEKMIEVAGVDKNDTVVEIGPGFGALTFALAEKAGKVIAFEIEKKIELYWIERLKDYRRHEAGSRCGGKNLEIVWGNVLMSFRAKREISTNNRSEDSSGESLGMTGIKGNYKVVANLPYQITSNVIRKFLEMENKPSVLVLMVQKEVGERICAKPACPGVAGKRSRGDMSLLSLSVQYYAEPEIVTIVPRTSFWPSPAVDSAVIRLVTHNSQLATGCHSEEERRGIPTNGRDSGDPSHGARDDSFDEKFFKVAKAGFAQKRKLLVKNLEGFFDKEKVLAVLSQIGHPATARAQELSVEDWKALVESL